MKFLTHFRIKRL